jgi:bla regulator protein blaR1
MHLLNDETMQAICWTLIHSLWQGLLLAVLAGLVIMLTKKSSSVFRYNVLSVLFFLFVATACITFLKQYNFAYSNSNVGIIQSTGAGQITNIHAYPVNEVASGKTYPETFTNYFNEHASLIVMIWFVVLSAQCIRLIANAGYVQRIKHYKTHAPSACWNERMLFLASKLQIKQRVKLLQSEMVKVPVMVGFLKPVILFPFQLMSQLPAEQVEAVLLHELAHIKRKDYFVNLLQNFAEIIFFFNPGVLWISSLIKEERENCCDDIAIAETKRKNEFIQALVSFQEYNLNSTKYALAFPGRKNHLLDRVKRILTNHNKTLNNMEKISLATGIVVIGLLTIAFKQAVKQNSVKDQPVVKSLQAKEIKNDTVPDKTEAATLSFNGNIEGKKYKIKELNGKVVELYVDEKKIAKDKIGDYQAIIDQLHADAKKQQDELEVQHALMEKQRAELIEQEERMNKDRAAQEGLLNKERAELEELREKANNNEAISKLNAEQEAVNAKMEILKQSNKPNKEEQELINKQNKELNEHVLDLKKRQFELMQQSKLMEEKELKEQSELLLKKQIDLKVQEMILQNEQLHINKMLLDYKFQHNLVSPVSPEPEIVPDLIKPVPPVPPVMESKPISSIIDDLIDAKVITDRDNLSFTLNSEVLKVNGVVQSEELHAKLKEKYAGGKKDHVIYSKHGGSTHADVVVNK